MDNWYREQTLYLIIGIICMVFFAFFFVYKVITSESKNKKKYLDVLYPTNDIKESDFKYDKKGEIKVKKKSKVKKKLDDVLNNSKIALKIQDLYYRAGKSASFKDLILDGIKYLFLGVGIFFILKYAIGNLLISGLIAVVIVAMPYISLISKIQAREKEFRNTFPYFLQTVAFVLKNGTNFSNAFHEVTHKQENGVLKEIMLEVLEIRNINAGDDTIAFKHITKKMKVLEAAEFVNSVMDNLSKGTSVADVFLNQAENTSKILELNKKKKIAAASTKILVPILVLIVSIAVLFLQMF